VTSSLTALKRAMAVNGKITEHIVRRVREPLDKARRRKRERMAALLAGKRE